MAFAKRVDDPTEIDLSKFDPDETQGLRKKEGESRFTALGKEFGALQELLFAAGKHAVLVVLQGRDTSGKDGTIRSVFDFANPQGVDVEAFKVPTPEELAHDFLWRCHRVTPPKGRLGIFNRSYYEDVLVARVHKLVPEAVWRKRYEHINDWEHLLTDEGTIVLKFYLHISKQEQEERLLAREDDVEKAWKLSVGDWKERELWDDYTAAYEDALGRCATHYAPWYIVPADKKWFRNLAVAEAIVEALRPYRDQWLAVLKQMGADRIRELQAFRAQEHVETPRH